MKRIKNSRTTRNSILFGLLMFSTASLNVSAESLSSDDQMNQTREEMERQRIQRQIEEDRRRNQENIEDNRAEEPTPHGGSDTLSFTLNNVTTDTSEVIDAETLRDIVKPYIGRAVVMSDIKKIVDAINQYYVENGFLTCKAYLKPQKIEGGVLHISLNEALNGQVILTGNKSTSAKYIRNRLRLQEGKLQNFKELDNDITRFNGTNDANLRISIKPGVEPNTTDYEIVVIEPQRATVNIFADNFGQTATGVWREGLLFNYASLTGNRDALTLGYTHSIGSNAFSFDYEVPITNQGTKLRLDYSTNGTEHKSGQFRKLIKGHSNYYSATITHPITVNLNGRSEWSLGFNSQASVSTFKDIGTFADNRSDSVAIAFTQINYKPLMVAYQKHTYEFGNAHNKIDQLHRCFGLYKFYGFIRKVQPHGQSIYARLSAQITSRKDLASANTFSIGGYYSVRGYKTQFLEGDNGFDFSVEYSVPVLRNLNAFAFFDCGKIRGENSLVSTGLGLQFYPIKNVSANLVIGFPLKRHIGDEEVSKSRISFVCNGSF